MSTTKPDTETGWSKEFPKEDGDYLCRINEHDLSPVSFRLENGAIYEYGCGKNLRSDYHHNARGYEFLGPFAPSDFEQLRRLREAAGDSANWIETQTWPCQHSDMPMHCTRCATRQKAKELVAALREALGETK